DYGDMEVNMAVMDDYNSGQQNIMDIAKESVDEDQREQDFWDYSDNYQQELDYDADAVDMVDQNSGYDLEGALADNAMNMIDMESEYDMPQEQQAPGVQTTAVKPPSTDGNDAYQTPPDMDMPPVPIEMDFERSNLEDVPENEMDTRAFVGLGEQGINDFSRDASGQIVGRGPGNAIASYGDTDLGANAGLDADIRARDAEMEQVADLQARAAGKGQYATPKPTNGNDPLAMAKEPIGVQTSATGDQWNRAIANNDRLLALETQAKARDMISDYLAGNKGAWDIGPIDAWSNYSWDVSQKLKGDWQDQGITIDREGNITIPLLDDDGKVQHLDFNLPAELMPMLQPAGAKF
ncbi:MAG: hypothetical protein DRJ61_19445, partial [Acidobacteria bacterium]